MAATYWASSGGNQRVEIVGSAGIGPDGREYVNIKGSKTAVPMDEIVDSPTARPNKKAKAATKTVGSETKKAVKAEKTPSKLASMGDDVVKSSDDLIESKVLKKADDLADYWSKSPLWAKYALVGAAATVGVASILDGVNDRKERSLQYKQQRIQEKNLKRKNESSNQYKYMGMTNPGSNVGLVQQMFGNRSGHSNSWGGKRY